MTRVTLSVGFQRVLSLFILVCCLTVPAWASPKSRIHTYLMHSIASAIADLDGDHIPDIAGSIKLGHSELGYSYRVDLDLSTNAHVTRFTVLSDESTGLNIEATD